MILQYRFDDENGLLSPNTPFKLPGERGGGPRHCCFHPRRNIVNFSNEQGCFITAYDLNPEEGTLAPFQILSTIPDGYDNYTNCASIRISHSGRWLFVLNRGSHSVACFAGDPMTGRLRLHERVPLTSGRENWKLIRTTGFFLWSVTSHRKWFLFDFLRTAP